MKFDVTDWNLAESMRTKEEVIAFLWVLLEENDPPFFLSALKDIETSKGLVELARELGVTREALCVSLSGDGNPSFSKLLNALNSMGFTIDISLKKTA